MDPCLKLSYKHKIGPTRSDTVTSLTTMKMTGVESPRLRQTPDTPRRTGVVGVEYTIIDREGHKPTVHGLRVLTGDGV